MKRYKLLWLLWCLPFGLCGQSLSDYLEMAGKNNLGLQAAHARYQAALQRIPQKGRLPDPQVSFAAFVLPIETRVGPQRANIGLRQMFPWFGVRAAERSVEMKKALVHLRAVDAEKNSLYFKVREQYYRMYQLEKDIAVTTENLKILAAYTGLALKEYESGKRSMVNVVRIKMAVNELENRLVNLEDQRAVFRVRFNVLLNREEKEAVVVPETIGGFSRDMRYLRDSLRKHPAFAVLEARRVALQEANALNDKGNRPSFSVGLNYVFVGQRTDAAVPGNGRDALMPSVGFSLPLNGKAQEARRAELAQLQEVIRLEEEARFQDLLAEFIAVEADLKAAERRMLLYRTQIKQADQALELLLISYSVGGTDMEEVLKMQVQRLGFLLALDKAQTDQLIQYARILSLIGGGNRL